jgi:hypothetical protein
MELTPVGAEVPITAASVAAKPARAGIREQPRPKADKDRSGLRKFIIEAHFAGRKSLM